MTNLAEDKGKFSEIVRDLGFGQAGDQTVRLLNRDGTFNVEKRGISSIESLSLYHKLFTTTWPKFFLIVVALYLISNVIFSIGYFLCGPEALDGIDTVDVGHRLFQCFFFSVQTIATIGYGKISPVALSANILVTIESLYGLTLLAVVTGVVFSRFSRPAPKVKFSANALIAPFQGTDSLQIRLVNLRKSQLLETRAQILFSYLDQSSGRAQRRYHRLPLFIDQVTVFPLYWTITHLINESSVLYGKTHEDLKKAGAEFLVFINGTDEISSEPIHLKTSYRAEELVFKAKFKDMYVHSSDASRPAIDVALLGQYEKIA